LRQTNETVPSLQTTWAYALVDTNPLAEWANQALILDDHPDDQGRPVAVVNVGRAHKIDRSNDYEHQDTWFYPNYRAWVDDTGGKPLSSRRFTGHLKDLFENQLRLEGVEHRDDNKGSRFFGLRFRAPSDADKPLLITKHPPPVMDVTCMVTAETRTSDGCDACDGFLLSLYGHLPTPCVPLSLQRGGGVSIEENSKNPSNPSHPSLMRTLDVTDVSQLASVRQNGIAPVRSPVTEPLPEGPTGVGDWVWTLSEKGEITNATPYRIQQIAVAPDGRLFAWFREGGEAGSYWPLAHCEKTDPPASASSDEADEPWPSEVVSPPTKEGFDELFENMLDAQEERQMRQYFPPPAQATDASPAGAQPSPALRLPLKGPTPAQGCPQCGCTALLDCVTYKKCPLCPWKDGPTPQEILEQREARP
jgi:hypothetical protein